MFLIIFLGLDLYYSAFSRTAEDKVVAPYMVLSLWPQPYTRSVVEPQSPALGLLMGHFEPFPAPYTLDALVVNGIAFPP
jgi:hypothetical protein